MIFKIARLLVKTLPEPAAFRLVCSLAGRTQRPAVRPPQQEALAQARQVHYGAQGHNVAWEWGQTGPLVILVHGWGGSAAQIAPRAAALAQQGFHCVAIDVTGHGSSPGARTTWRCFIDDIAALTTTLGQPVHAYVAHSAGALTAMAARGIHDIGAARYVCICAPSHPHPPITVIRQKLDPPAGVLQRYREHIAQQFDADWATLATGTAYAGAGSNLLLFYDTTDRYIDHEEGNRLQALCPGAQLIKTTQYGHTRVLEAPELAQAVGEFLQA
ncbi:alpha/beta fold hydrolase [Hydrogenophaga sp.]|uniref:alpha/beta fold hydrolase n=1 Tax=Hydrogenophaga sp. TaxID=1904254 RepID=UPI002AB9F120|nr:alpha/beta fold hydrolase [Hydrogenophaga sp.]MDZ4144483.1 alpha/beta fold hydrolase [Burkholderiales bacterium]MDZ4398066.1 alpha/beta fold hydrolase [Hydrogenophaga sp.]